MKKKTYLLILLAVISGCSNKKQEEKSQEQETPQVATIERGQQLFQDNNCAACHQPDQKVVGPSLQEIAKIYKEKNASIVSFLKEEAQPIVDPSMYESMKINLQITKNLSEEELQSLEMYFLSQAK